MDPSQNRLVSTAYFTIILAGLLSGDFCPGGFCPVGFLSEAFDRLPRGAGGLEKYIGRDYAIAASYR